jgi:(1->4)-alpha-D-glucan 1-alpha-D-glucosylmutase
LDRHFTATYRVQLRPGFDFERAAELAPYLARLGISHIYLSPIFQATPGSTHGYDVVDPTAISAELGGELGYGALSAALSDCGVGQLVDVVPNHMAISGPENNWWWDVLENGPASIFAGFFDVDWSTDSNPRANRISLPVLGDRYGRCLERGELALVRSGGDFEIRYFDHRFPVAPSSLAAILVLVAETVRLSSDLLSSTRLMEVVTALMSLRDLHLPEVTEGVERHQAKASIGRNLAYLLARHPTIARAVDDELARINSSPARLDEILEFQNYRLTYWRTSVQEMGYRRFFDITSLIGVRVELQEAFEASHGRILALLADGSVDGVRVDHIDGLRDPGRYLNQLASLGAHYVVVEKILAAGELLPRGWPVAGTTGYEFASMVTRLFMDPSAELAFDRAWRRIDPEFSDFTEMSVAAKREILSGSLQPDLDRLAVRLLDLAQSNWRYRDTTIADVTEALGEVLARFPVYRTYFDAAGASTTVDMATCRRAVEAARQRPPTDDGGLLDLIEQVLVGEGEVGRAPAAGQIRLAFQQLSPPTMAKGMEDTVFYRYNRFVALNEVGASPDMWSVGVEEFHAFNRLRQATTPLGLSTLTTHDTKRSGDIRARLAVLSEIPKVWTDFSNRFLARSARHWPGSDLDEGFAYGMLQNLVGAWPVGKERAIENAIKSARESKLQTSWLSVDSSYEAALVAWLEGILDDPELNSELARFVDTIGGYGRLNSLASTVILATCPGIPDIFQGTESWRYLLVDPDNRRPVEYRSLRAELDQLPDLGRPGALAGLSTDHEHAKLVVLASLLNLRRRQPGWFGSKGDYQPLVVNGTSADHVVAFLRAGSVLVVVPRLLVGLIGFQAGSTCGQISASVSDALEGTSVEVAVESTDWQNWFDGQPISVADRCLDLRQVLAGWPVAVLTPKGVEW